MLQQSALAAAGATEDNEHFARVDFEVNMSQDDLPVVGGGEIFHPDDRLALRTHRHSNSKVVVFFFKQKTAYDIGLGIPAEPLFRSLLSRKPTALRLVNPSAAKIKIFTASAL